MKRGGKLTLRKKLDAVFSRFIRYRDGGQCYTCPKKDDPKRMQCGHFNPRQYLRTRWDERNNHCQCYACNFLYNGQPSRYAQHLIEDFGLEIINELEKDRLIPIKLDDSWYLGKIAYYEKELDKITKNNIDY